MIRKHSLFVWISLAVASGIQLQSLTPEPGRIGAEPIQAVFSHPIIAFGSDLQQLPGDTSVPLVLRVYRDAQMTEEVPLSQIGRWRHVTTSIARFDTFTPYWPTDLYIKADVDYAALAALSGDIFEGESITEGPTWESDKLEWYVGGVISRVASDATDGQWTPTIYRDSDEREKAFEVPADGVIQIQFSQEVSFSKISTSGFYNCGVSVDSPCRSSDEDLVQCINTTLKDPLPNSATCSIAARTDILYSSVSGYISEQKEVLLSGLIDFSFGPFVERRYGGTQSRQLQLYIRHGLPVGTDLGPQFTISPALEGGFTANVTQKSVCLLKGKFVPDTVYTVTIAASDAIVDNLGMALRGSEGDVSMGEENMLVLRANSRSQVIYISPDDALSEFPVVYRGLSTSEGEQGSLSSCEVTESNLWELVRNTFSYSNEEPLCNSRSVSLQGEGRSGIDLSFVSTSVQLVFVRYPQRYGGLYSDGQFVVQTNLHVVVLKGEEQDGSYTRLLVTDLKSGAAVEGAEVEARPVRSREEQAVRATTDSQGFALLRGECSYCAVKVVSGSNLYILESPIYIQPGDDKRRLHAKMAVDRGLYSVGESMALSGWILQSNCEGVAVCVGEGVNSIDISVRWSSNYGTDPMKYEAAVAADGSFSRYIEVPQEAQYGYQPFVSIDSDSQNINAIYSPFVIADPRLPSAVLSLSAPEYLLLGASSPSLSVSLDLQSFTGIPLGDTKTSWEVSVREGEGVGCEEEEKGDRVVTFDRSTDVDGKVELNILSLSGTNWLLTKDDTIYISVRTIDPTGSPLSEEIRVAVVDSLYILENIATSIRPILPATPFALTAAVSARFGGFLPANMSDVAASFAVVPQFSCEDAIFPAEADGACRVADAQVLCENVVSPFLASGDVSALLRVELGQGERLEGCVAVDSSLVSEWQTQLSLRSNTTAAQAGDVVRLSFHHPFPAEDAVAWVIYPDPERPPFSFTLRKLTEEQYISFEVPTSLSASTYDVAVFIRSLPSIPSSISTGEAPVSLTATTWGPLTSKGTISLELLTLDSFIDSQVAVAAPQTASPGEEVTIEIDVGGETGGGRAFVYVVDASILELQPFPLTSLQSSQVLSRTLVYIDDFTVPSSGQRIVQSAMVLEDLVRLDPFLYIEWSSFWLDGDFEEIIASSRYQEPITEGNFPYTIGFLGISKGLSSVRSGCIARKGGELFFDGSPEIAFSASGGAESAGIAFDDFSSPTSNSPTAAGSSSPPLRAGVDTVRLALFSETEIVGGRAAVTFNLPLDRTKWNIRTYTAIANENAKGPKSYKYGAAEASITVSSPVYLEAFVPRYLRITDVPVLGAVIQTDPSGPFAGKTAVVNVESVSDELEILQDLSVTRELSRASVYATYPVRVLSVPPGTKAAITLSLSVDGEVVDRLLMELEVSLHAHPLLIGTSRAVRAPSDWEETVQLPAFIAPASEVRVSASVSQYDSLLSLCSRTVFAEVQMMMEDGEAVSAEDWVAVAYCFHVLREDDYMSYFSNDHRNVDQIVSILASEYTDPSSGQLRSSSDRSTWRQTRSVSVSVSLASLGGLMLRLTGNGDSPLFASWLAAAVSYIASIESLYAGQGPVDQSREAALIHLAVGGESSDLLTGLPDRYRDTAGLKAALEEEDLYTRLIVNAAEGREDADIIRTLRSAIRVSSDTSAYIAVPSSAQALPDAYQALALLSLNQPEVLQDEELVWRVAAYIGRGGEAAFNPWNTRGSAASVVYAGIALLKLDSRLDNNDPDVNVEVRNGSISIAQWRLTKTDRSASISGFAQGGGSSSRLSWVVEGVGTVFAYLTANLVPLEPWKYVVQRGFLVKKFIQALDVNSGTCSGEMISSIASGRYVCVSLEVTSSDDVREVEITDLMSGGLEAIDSNVGALADLLDALNVVGTGTYGSPCPYSWGFYCNYIDRRVTKSSVHWTVRGFQAGSKSVSYVALANIPGKYVLPASKAMDPDNPSYLGLSGTSEFLVDPADQEITLQTTRGPLQRVSIQQARRVLLSEGGTECPPPNPSSGWCDTTSGMWMCGQDVCAAVTSPITTTPRPSNASSRLSSWIYSVFIYIYMSLFNTL